MLLSHIAQAVTIIPDAGEISSQRAA